MLRHNTCIQRYHGGMNVPDPIKRAQKKHAASGHASAADVAAFLSKRAAEEAKNNEFNLEFALIAKDHGPELATIFALDQRLHAKFMRAYARIPEEYRVWFAGVICHFALKRLEEIKDCDWTDIGLDDYLAQLNLTEYEWEYILESTPDAMKEAAKDEFAKNLESAITNFHSDPYERLLRELCSFLNAIEEIGFERTMLLSRLVRQETGHNDHKKVPWRLFNSILSDALSGSEMLQIVHGILLNQELLSEIESKGLFLPEAKYDFLDDRASETIVLSLMQCGGMDSETKEAYCQLLKEANPKVKDTAVGILCLYWWNVPGLVDHVTVGTIERAENIEIRRALIECYGQVRYLVDSGAKVIHSDSCGTLYRKELPDDAPLLMVKVVNKTPEPDGSFGEYFLRVPPEMKTAREAVAWTFGMPVEDYNPVTES